MKKRTLVIFITLLFMFQYVNLTVYGTQSRDYNFNKNYSLTGNLQNDIVSVAVAQLGKTQSNLGYTEAWCADFVTDCAKLTGMSDKIIPYNYASRGACTSLYNYMVNNCGATKVSSRQKGDIVFYYCSSCARYVHVGIVESTTTSIEGNYDGKVCRVTSVYIDASGHSTSNGKITKAYLRPKYSTHTHSYTTYISTSSSHPHNKIYKCSCGATQENTSQPTFGLECASCLNPITPVAEQEFNGSKYLLFDSPIPWNDAKSYCEQFGGHLATVTSEQENTFLQSFISCGSQTGYWLGATDAESEGTWKWVTGETFSYTDWYSDNPNNSGEREHYLEIRKDYDNQWNDDTIDKYVSTALVKEGFILEIDMKNYKSTNELLYNGSQYILFDISLPWHYAQEYCESIGGNLAVITSQEENALIQELISKGNKKGYWLGANDTETEGVWEWVTGETFSYADWYGDNPNNGGDHEHYLEIRKDYGNKWNDDTLDKFLPAALITEGFICEIDISDDLPVVAETSFNGHRYLLFDMSISWPEAQEYCEGIGGHLATVTSVEEDAIIQALISKGGKSGYWLGATDTEAEGTWKWITGEGFGYTNWYDGNPNNSGSREHYLEIRKDYGNKWNDDTIDKYVLSALMTEGFICEFELTEKPVDLGDTFYAKIKNEHIGNYVTNDISNVSLRKNNNSNNQIWKFEKTQDGSYLITSEYNNGYLNVYYARTGNNANIDVCGGYNESGAEHWYIYEKDGLYLFRPKCSNFVMSVDGASSTEGANIQTNTYDWSTAQSFVIEEDNLFSFVSKNGTVHAVEINGYGLDNTCQIIVCGYDNKKLVDYEIVTFNQIEQPITIIGNIDEIKVMAWNNLSLLTPLCDAKVIPSIEWITQ